jgi:Ca2+-transporting ATPase
MGSGESIEWMRLPAADAIAHFGSDPGQGLSTAEALQRLELDGRNELPQDEGRHFWQLVAEQFRDVLIYLLLVAAVISIVVGEPVDAIVIVIIIVLNALIGIVQGRRADQALSAIRELSAPRATVIRSGEIQFVESADLVCGDIVILEAGNTVPADLRVLTGASLGVAEAVLTGESLPVVKGTEPVAGSADENIAIGDQTSMCFRGTDVVAGRATGVVVATGSNTELGHIADLVAGAEHRKTPMQRRLASLSGRIAIAVVIISAVVFVAGILRGEDPTEMLLTAVSLAVAAVPEALPAVVTISLALGAAEMVRQQALTRRLPAVETLGSVTHICTDKTGTLTTNKMQVEDVWLARTGSVETDGHDADGLALAASLCNDATITSDRETGDPTETALLRYARDDRGLAFDQQGTSVGPTRMAEFPFDSDFMRMTTVNGDEDGDLVAYCKGAPEVVIPRCSSDTDGALEKAQQMATSGLRVLAVARRDLLRVPVDRNQVEQDMELVGLVGLLDPPREAAALAVAECISAGIVPIMITGDHPATAAAIAERVGIGDGENRTMTGVQLAELDETSFEAQVDEVSVYARVDPAQKIRIVRALQHGGSVAAMTGDGVNDAPALKQADIGVAMGEGGTDVARGASDLVLLDNNFATIVTAVREGRRIYDNIRRFVRYTLTSNSGEIWTIFLAPFLGLPLPLLPLQILWINLVTDGLPGLALAREPAEPDVMERPPRPPKQSVFAGGMVSHIIWVGLLIGGLSLGTMAITFHAGSPNWQSVVFTTLVFCQLANAFAIRSERRSIWHIGLYSNPALVWSLVAMAGLQMAVVYLPLLQGIFHTSAMSGSELMLSVAAAMVVFIAVEAEKVVRRRSGPGDRLDLQGRARVQSSS